MGEHRKNPDARRFGIPRGVPIPVGTHATGPIRLRDTFNRELEIGDEVLVRGIDMVQYVVQDIAPEMDPRAPAGMMRIVLQATIMLGAPRNAAMANVIRIRTAEEKGLVNGRPSAEDGEQTPVDPKDGPVLREEPPGALVPKVASRPSEDGLYPPPCPEPECGRLMVIDRRDSTHPVYRCRTHGWTMLAEATDTLRTDPEPEELI